MCPHNVDKLRKEVIVIESADGEVGYSAPFLLQVRLPL